MDAGIKAAFDAELASQVGRIVRYEPGSRRLWYEMRLRCPEEGCEGYLITNRWKYRPGCVYRETRGCPGRIGPDKDDTAWQDYLRAKRLAFQDYRCREAGEEPRTEPPLRYGFVHKGSYAIHGTPSAATLAVRRTYGLARLGPEAGERGERADLEEP